MKLTLNQTLLFGQGEFQNSVGLIQLDLQNAVLAFDLCDFLFYKIDK